MTVLDPVFLDTAPLIYLVENDVRYSQDVADFLAKEFAQENSIMTSVLTVSEFNVKPIRQDDVELLENFQKALSDLHAQIFDITLKIVKTAAGLRAKYKSLKTVDALQIGCAINYVCKRFLTNDHRLKGVDEIQVILIGELKS
ncbi:MAG: PIN domain-containing protein [Bacteroidetes bacterium]|nr:PIN domain-containing protein [Bacteroidota bacterium]MBI3482735.1 PIN domain-containing protein [Bacteroidota bacterium]